MAGSCLIHWPANARRSRDCTTDIGPVKFKLLRTDRVRLSRTLDLMTLLVDNLRVGIMFGCSRYRVDPNDMLIT
jgi:hypothetical protein